MSAPTTSHAREAEKGSDRMTERERAAGDEIAAFPEAVWRGPFCDYREAMAGVSEAADAVFFASLWAVTLCQMISACSRSLPNISSRTIRT